MYNNHPLISIAIPVYNCEKYISFAINSVINQTYQNWELIIIDDGSTDNTLSIIKGYTSSKIRVYSDGENKGLIYRLNESVRVSSGEYYARMDADDVMHPLRLEKELSFLCSHPDIDVVGSSYCSIDSENNIIHKVKINGLIRREDIRFLHPSVMAKTSWFKKNPYSSLYIRMEDYELWLRTSARNKLYSMADSLMYYREFGVPTLTKYIQSQKGIIKLHLKYKSYGLNISTALKKILSSFLKIIVAILLCSLNLQKLLIKLRKVHPAKIDSKDIEFFRIAIKSN